MPYIKQAARDELDVGMRTAETSGELNYELTVLIRSYLESQGRSYQTMNDIVGALDGAKVEFQRRIVAPYEDEKIEQNGDVY